MENNKTIENTTVFAKLPGVMVSATLVIKNFTEATALGEPGMCYSSDTFSVGTVPLCIEVFPNGKKSTCKNWVRKKGGEISVGILNKSDKDITIMGWFTTEAKRMGFIRDVKARQRWGINHFLSHAQCATTYKDKDFRLTATIEVSGKDLKILGKEFTNTGPPEHDYRERLFRQMKNPDFKLLFNGAQAECHKHILAASSPVFGAMLQGQFKENIENQCTIDVPEDIGQAFVHFIYMGKLDKDILKQEAVSLFELGERYDIPALKHLAEGEMLKQLNKDNMLEMLTLGNLFKAKTIFEAALEMTKANLSWINSQEDAQEKMRNLSQDIKNKLKDNKKSRASLLDGTWT